MCDLFSVGLFARYDVIMLEGIKNEAAETFKPLIGSFCKENLFIIIIDVAQFFTLFI